MLLFILLLIVCVLLGCSYFAFKGDATNPAVIFLCGFAFSAFWSLLNVSRWDYELSSYGFVVVTSGILVFVIVSAFVGSLVPIPAWGVNLRSDAAEKEAIKPLELSHFKIGILVLFQLIILLWTAAYISYQYPADSLAGSIQLLDNYTKFGDDGINGSYMGFPLATLRTCSDVVGLVILVLFAKELASRSHKYYLFLFVGVVFSFANIMLTGGRLSVAKLALVFLVGYVWFYRRSSRYSKRTSARLFAILIIAAVVVLFTFQASLSLFGRSSDLAMFDYLSLYLGTQIPNFDYFLDNVGVQDTGIFGYATFININNWIGRKLGDDSLSYGFDQPFLMNGSFDMGNVYTMFYSFYYDFGFVGVIALTALMALLVTLAWKAYARTHNEGVQLFLIVLYGVMVYCTFFSFYCDRFYEDIFSVGFVYQLVYLALIVIFLNLPLSPESRFKVCLVQKRDALNGSFAG